MNTKIYDWTEQPCQKLGNFGLLLMWCSVGRLFGHIFSFFPIDQLDLILWPSSHKITTFCINYFLMDPYHLIGFPITTPLFPYEVLTRPLSLLSSTSGHITHRFAKLKPIVVVSSDAEMSSVSEYQVFLSFRGPDACAGFIDVLFHSLTDAEICVFRDDEELRIGDRIDGSLQRAIDNSRIYILIFSQTYASSQWCLRELAQIVANTFKLESNKEILPIFYDVEPDDVNLKTPLYRDAILSLELETKLSNDQVDSWREALKKIDVIKGWEVKKYKVICFQLFSQFFLTVYHLM